jgi:hypothetical protein
LLVCFAAMEESDWPAKHAWNAIQNAGCLDEFVSRFRTRLKQGDQPTPCSLTLYADWLVDRAAAGQMPKWLSRSWLNPAALRLRAFVRRVERSTWVQPAHIARLMQVLNQGNHKALVVACWRHLRARGQDTDTAAWAQTGNALVSLRRKRAARALLSDWRSRTGVQMWMLANYLISLPRLTEAGRNEVVETCKDGLAKLAHDHCASYLAYMGAEACALNRDQPGLLAFWEHYARYFESPLKQDDFFPAWQRYLIADVPVAVRILSEPARRGYNRLLMKLYSKRLWNPPTRARLRRLLVLLARLILIASMSAGALRDLFR